MLGYLLRKNPLEIYRITIDNDVISFTITKALFDALSTFVTRIEVRDRLFAIDRKEEGDVVSFLVTLPFITFPNFAHKGINWRVLGECSEKVSLLLWLINIYLEPKESSEPFFLSDKPQLMAVATSYSKEREMHACPMEVGFSESATILLNQKYQKVTSVDVAAHEAARVYLRLSAKSKKEFEKEMKYLKHSQSGMFGVIAMVRDSGVPQFSVPGNCACLGENPDRFRDSRDMCSHNLDSTLQQMTMLVAVVTFWNKFLTHLYQKSL